MSIRSTIIELIQSICETQNKPVPQLTDDLLLLNTGLDSLGIAVLVASLEDKLGFDPFTRDDGGFFPVTVGDFIALYEHAPA